MCPTLCTFIFKWCLYSLRGLVIPNEPMLCVTDAHILPDCMLVFILKQDHILVWYTGYGQYIPCQNSSLLSLTQVTYTRGILRVYAGYYMGKSWLCVLKWAVEFIAGNFLQKCKVPQSAKISLIFFLMPPAATESCPSFNTSQIWSFSAVTVSRTSSGCRIYLEGRLQSDSEQKLTDRLNDKKPNPKESFRDR